MFMIVEVEQQGKKRFMAVTYLRTALIGFQATVDTSELEGLSGKCETHEHSQGIILEVGRLE